MGNPLVASPIYNNNGNLAFQYNRIKAIHLGWSGDISNEWTYRAKLSFNRTWGTPFKPIPEILENFLLLQSLNISQINGKVGALPLQQHLILETFMAII